MAQVATHGDAVRIMSEGAEVQHLHAIGTIPGVVIVRAAGRNGVGTGVLRSGGGTALTWQAPGSATEGAAVDCGAGGDFLLEDGDDADCWIHVVVYTAHLMSTPQEASVYFADVFNNALAGTNQLASGEGGFSKYLQYTVEVKNDSAAAITDVRVWLDPAVSDLAIGTSGASWWSPTSEFDADVVVWASIAAGDSRTLHLQRPILAGADPDPDVLAHLHFAWTSSERHYGAMRGKMRIFRQPEYRFYAGNSLPPVEGETPFATASSLPHTPNVAWTDGTWFVSMSYFNGVLDSGFLPIGDNGETYLRLDISSGAEQALPPKGPAEWKLVARPNGVVRVIGYYTEEAAARGTEWAIAYTTNGSDPPSGAPSITPAIAPSGTAVLSYDLPAAADGANVKVRLQIRRDDSGAWVYSENDDILSVTADASGPAAPVGGDRWRGAAPGDV